MLLHDEAESIGRLRHTDLMPKVSAAICKLEFMTFGVALLIYGGFIALTLSFQVLPRWLVAILGSLLLTWYGSLQHETIHGHPTPWRRFNSLLGALPLTL